jgi:hypothetical protein
MLVEPALQLLVKLLDSSPRLIRNVLLPLSWLVAIGKYLQASLSVRFLPLTHLVAKVLPSWLARSNL